MDGNLQKLENYTEEEAEDKKPHHYQGLQQLLLWSIIWVLFAILPRVMRCDELL